MADLTDCAVEVFRPWKYWSGTLQDHSRNGSDSHNGRVTERNVQNTFFRTLLFLLGRTLICVFYSFTLLIRSKIPASHQKSFSS